MWSNGPLQFTNQGGTCHQPWTGHPSRAQRRSVGESLPSSRKACPPRASSAVSSGWWTSCWSASGLGRSTLRVQSSPSPTHNINIGLVKLGCSFSLWFYSILLVFQNLNLEGTTVIVIHMSCTIYIRVILLKGKATCSAAPTSVTASAWPPLGASLSCFSWRTLAWGCSSSHCISSGAGTWAPYPPLVDQSQVAHSHGRLHPCHLQKNQPLLIYHLQTKLVMVRPHVLSVRALVCPKFKVFQFRPCWMDTHQVDTSESPWPCVKNSICFGMQG